MPYRTNLIYHYDGSYQGFLCCVAQCFRAKELPPRPTAWCERGFSPACPSGRWPCCAFC